jgi:hypothetical protein
MKKYLSKYYPIAFFGFALLLYLSPFLILGQRANVYMHDTLEEMVVVFKTLAESGEIFAPYNQPMPETLQGHIRASYPSSFNPITWLYYFFSPFQAYLINQFLIRIFAFLGMYFLLSRHINTKKEYKFINTVTAILFSLIPFWPLGGLSVAGAPLLLYSLLNFKTKQNKTIDIILLVFISFYSYFERSHIFLVGLLSIWWVWEFVFKKKANWRFLTGIVIFIFTSIFAQHQLIFQMFFASDYTSHRVEFAKLSLWGVDKFGVLEKIRHNFLWGQEHVQAIHFLILPVCIIGFLVCFFGKKKFDKLQILLLALCFFISFIFGLWYWNGFEAIVSRFAFLNSFNASRFHWLHPMLWYLVLAISFKVIKKHSAKLFWPILTLFLILQTNQIIQNHEHVKGKRLEEPTYQEFFATDLFGEIDSYIGQDQSSYYTVSIGINPSIPRYNGFFTLDAYSGNYPLEFKHKFREIIERELGKNEENKKYFDHFGNRCYILTAELGKEFRATKYKNKKIKNLELNFETLEELNVVYVFSAVEIANYEENGMIFERKFENENSAWDIYLYKIV